MLFTLILTVCLSGSVDCEDTKDIYYTDLTATECTNQASAIYQDEKHNKDIVDAVCQIQPKKFKK